jgi:hypothetical protein
MEHVLLSGTINCLSVAAVICSGLAMTGTLSKKFPLASIEIGIFIIIVGCVRAARMILKANAVLRN